MTTNRLSRRSFTRTKAACTLCRQRRVRCDGARPTCNNCVRYGSKSEPCLFDRSANTTPPATSPPEWWSSAQMICIQQLKALSPPKEIQAQYSLMSEDPTVEDIHLLHHLNFFTCELTRSQGHQLSFGTLLLTHFFKQAQIDPCARDSLLALSAHHIAHLTQLSTARVTEIAYMEKACRSLAHALNHFEEDRLDAALMSSVILSWTSDDSRAYGKFAKGTCSLLEHGQQGASVPALMSFLEDADPLPTDDKRLMIKYLSLPEPELKQFTPLSAGLATFRKIYCKRDGLDVGAKALINLLENLRLELRGSGTINESRALWEVRTWIPWMPEAVIGLSTRDIGTLLLCSFYEAVLIATNDVVPSLSPGLFVAKRAAVIGKAWRELNALEAEYRAKSLDMAEISEALELMVVPLVYAVRHRLQHSPNSSGQQSPP